jgi:hypothetical protein
MACRLRKQKTFQKGVGANGSQNAGTKRLSPVLLDLPKPHDFRADGQLTVLAIRAMYVTRHATRNQPYNPQEPVACR